MSVARAFADQDTTLWEKSTTANTGASPILQVQNVFNSLKSRKEWSRVIIRFGLSSLTGAIANTRTYPDPRTDSTVSAYLYMFNAPHGDEQAQSFDLNIHPLTQDWSEGSGLDLDSLAQTGYANAVSAKSTVEWTSTGGTYEVDSNSATQAFNHGEEHLKVNITNIFKAWLNGTTANFGLLIKMTDAQELKTGANSAITIAYKKFYSRETNTTSQPYIQLEWDGAVKDFRNFVEYNSTANLFFYNIKNGQLCDIASTADFPGNITLSGLSGASWSAVTTGLTASRFSKGIYRCNFSMPLTANVYTGFRDNWFVSASPTANYTQTFSTIDPTSGFDNLVTSSYKVILKNLREKVEKGTIYRVRLHIKDDSLVMTALTAATTAVSNFTVTDGTWEIREKASDLVEIPASAISFDKNGNFFEIDTNNLYRGVEYRIVLKLNMRGETLYSDFPEKWNFEVV